MESYKAWEDLTIQDDYMFKLIMRRKRICKAMLEKILQIKIHDLTYVEDEKTIQTDLTSHGVRLDVYVEDDTCTVYNIEMQVKNPGDEALARRTRYYQSMLDGDLFLKGADYDSLNDSYIIFICPFDIFGRGRHIYEIRAYCTQDRELLLPDGATRVFLNTQGTLDDVAPDVKAFLDYVSGIMSPDPLVQEIDAEIHRLKAITDERVRYMTYQMKMHEERKEGIKEGKIDSLKAVMKRFKLTLEDALEALEIPLSERDYYRTALAK